jgi:hypothetical protein
MKVLYPILCAIALLVACKETPTPAAPEVSEVKPEDCNRESGYFWSEVRKDCVLLFRDALKMKPAHPDARQHGSVFVIFSADSSQAEVRMPFERFIYIYDRQGPRGAKVWTKDAFTVDCRGEACRFLEGEKMLYREVEPRQSR